tara:strand:- start:244 stop:1212 length:969 start_codon:yes stop_codon:yes gene_type:complete
MTGNFAIALDTSPSVISEISALSLHNPFYTSEYITYRNSQGYQPWILAGDTPTQSKVYCLAFMKSGRLRRSLEIPSIPNIPTKDPFWQGLVDFCHKKGISDLAVNSFCSQSGVIPPLDNEKKRKTRWEHILKLKHPDFLRKMTKGHNYCIKRAKKTGVEMQRGRDHEAVENHARLISNSMQRRKERGETVTTSVLIENLFQLVDSGVAEIFQAVLADQILSSNIILIAEETGYNHTQGTSLEGMNCGAAHFLIHEIACNLRDDGKESFNLGGTDDPNPKAGLVKFKTGFGLSTERIELQSVRSTPGNVVSCLYQRFLSSIRN